MNDMGPKPPRDESVIRLETEERVPVAPAPPPRRGLVDVAIESALRDQAEAPRYPTLAVEAAVQTSFGNSAEAIATGLGVKPEEVPALIAALMEALEAKSEIHLGKILFDKGMTSADPVTLRRPLTEREGQVLNDLADGMNLDEIAAKRQIAKGTARHYLKNARTKTRASNDLELVRTGVATNVLTVLPPTDPPKA